MGSRVVLPETRKLPLSNGDWLLVKKRLNAGEHRAMFARMSEAGVDGQLRVKRLEVGLATILAYLVDWSLTDPAGKTLGIRGQSTDTVIALLDSLEWECLGEIQTAIELHIEAMARERDQEKNAPAGETPSAAISPSPSAAAGAWSGSAR